MPLENRSLELNNNMRVSTEAEPGEDYEGEHGLGWKYDYVNRIRFSTSFKGDFPSSILPWGLPGGATMG